MQTAKQIATELVENARSPHPMPNDRQQEITLQGRQATAILWQTMTDYFTSLWVKQYGMVGGEPFMKWAREIGRFDPMQVVMATDAVIQHSIQTNENYPPNLIKFLRFCREQKLKPDVSPLDALPPPEIIHDPDVIKAKNKCFTRARELGILR